MIVSSLKQNRGGHKFKYDYEAETKLSQWLITQDIDFYQQGAEKLVQYEKCFSCDGDGMKK
jgi:hypothetical protein